MKLQLFNNWKYKGKWNGNITNTVCITVNRDFYGKLHMIFGVFGICIFIFEN